MQDTFNFISWSEVVMKFLLAVIFVWLLAAMSMAKDQTASFKDVRWNGAKPIRQGGEIIFQVRAGQCGKLDYGDGRGESDCNGGRVRSQVQAPGEVRVGQTVEYRVEFFVPKSFSYPGDRSFPSGTRLLISEWKRNQGIKNHVYEILLDSRRGATFERSLCIKPSEFGKWNSFTLRIKWSKGPDGFMEARCNGRVILQRVNIQTVIPPDCGSDYKLQCEPARQIPGAPLLWSVGPNFSGYGIDYKRLGKSSPFAPFPNDGVEIRVRNLEVAKLS